MDRITAVEEKKLLPTEQIMGMSQEEFSALAESVAIVIPHRGSQGIKNHMAGNFPQWALWGSRLSAPEDEFGGFVELTRAGMVREFIYACQENPKLDKLVMIDGDETLDWTAPYQLAAWDLPVVSGVVCSYNMRRGIWAAFTVKDQYGVPRFPSAKYSQLPTKGLIKVHSCGTGLLCIKKSTIEALYEAGMKPFLIDDVTRDHAANTGILKHGEDMAFCRQCEKLGIDRHVDLSVHATHWKTIGLVWPTNRYDENLSAEEFKVDVREYHHGF